MAVFNQRLRTCSSCYLLDLDALHADLVDALHADLVQIRNFFKRPVQSRESCLPTHSHHHRPRADLHSDQYRHSYRPRALGHLCHTIVHSRGRGAQHGRDRLAPHARTRTAAAARHVHNPRPCHRRARGSDVRQADRAVIALCAQESSAGVTRTRWMREARAGTRVSRRARASDTARMRLTCREHWCSP